MMAPTLRARHYAVMQFTQDGAPEHGDIDRVDEHSQQSKQDVFDIAIHSA